MDGKLRAPRARRLLQHPHVLGRRGISVGEHRHAAGGGHHLHQDFLALAVEFGRENAKSPTALGLELAREQ
jgi:hypothetical protein